MYLVVHTGSRHLGAEVAEYYTKLAGGLLKKQDREGSKSALLSYYMSYLR